jgi:site-specific recombinase XerD
MQNHKLTKNGSGVVTRNKHNAFRDYLNHFKVHLEKRDYRPKTVAGYIQAIRWFETLLCKHRVALEDLDQGQAAKLILKGRWPAKKQQRARYVAKHFIRFLREQGVTRKVEPTREELSRQRLYREYEDYLRHERGLSEKSIHNLWYLIARFLKFLFNDDRATLSAVTAQDIARFMQHLHSRKQEYRVKTTATHLRWFFQFLFRAGKTKTNLSLSIPSVAQRWGQRLPRHLLPEQVEALLTAVRSDTPIGRRNHAMLLLLARLGLRPPEVIAMQLDDIDWHSGEIIVRGKGDLFDRVPLPQDVGEALASYIRHGRTTKSRALFVTERAPHVPFKGSQILNAVIKDVFAKTGIKPPARYVGAHILRHSLATNLVQRGASLDEIANVMRHRSRVTTMAYAKLDVEGLRSIALPWPVKGGAR